MSKRAPALVLGIVAFALLCFQIQVPISSVAPLLPSVRDALALSATAAGVLSSIPVLCFALLTPFASVLIARAGLDRAGVLCFVGVIVGALIRSSGSVPALFVGTVVLGAAITIANVAVPTLIARDYRHRAVLMTGVQTAAANVGASLAAALIVPTSLALGWQSALLLWSAVAVPALVVWILVHPGGVAAPARLTRAVRSARHPRSPAAELELRLEEVVTASIPVIAATPRDRAITRRPLAWLLAVAFAGHALCYYALVSWLPSFLAQDRGLSAEAAGVASSLFAILGAVGPLLLPVLATWFRWGLTALMVAVTALWVACPLGLVLAPEFWPLWIVAGGLAQGGTYTVISITVIERSRDEHDSRRLLTFVLTCGYAVAAVGPILLGVLRDSSGGWVVPFAMIAVVALIIAVAGIAATRTRPEPAA